MTPREAGFLLLGSSLGDTGRKCLSTAQLRFLTRRAADMEHPHDDRELSPGDLKALGIGTDQAMRILHLLDEKERLRLYLRRGEKAGCVPLTRVTDGYPLGLRQRLGEESPGVLWAKGDLALLGRRAVALVGSRELGEPNRAFAEEVGRQAALQGYVLISGNARGADRAAQQACLASGGAVISVVADELERHSPGARLLYLSEDSFDLPFSAQRALSRNRVIHAMGEMTMVAQCRLGMGGTWSGTVHNLRGGWSPVFCFRDGSEAVAQLELLGAQLIPAEALADLAALREDDLRLF